MAYNIKIDDYGNDLIKITHYEKPIKTNHKQNPPKHSVRTLSAIEHSKKTSLSRAKQKVYDYAMSNEWDWFLTITFSPEFVDRQNYVEVSKKLKYWIDETRRKNNEFKYIAIPEYHSDSVSFHFHILCSGIDIACFSDSGRTTDKGLKIYNVNTYKWGFTTATQIQDSKRATNYITKYFTKDMGIKTEGLKRYWVSRNLNVPTVTKLLDDVGTVVMAMDSDAYMFESNIVFKKQVDIKMNLGNGLTNWKQTITYFLIDTASGSSSEKV